MTLAELINECRNYIQSEYRFQELKEEYARKIRAEVIDECKELILDMSCVENCIHMVDCTECMAVKMEQLKEGK